nr:RNA-directed DNA polymerase, eukaryota, nucleotide-binding alpha-beta plait domain protein [Tanacetum cinerariifolium]
MASVLVNGSPTAEFQFHCGLKQGDPLASYLFILVMESLHLSFSRVVDASIFKGIKIDNSTMISHIFYADDAVFVGEWSDDNLSSIMHVLHCFSLASGLKINVKKSHLLGVGIPNDIIVAAASTLGCSIMKTPFKYLGVTVGGNMPNTSAWDDIINLWTLCQGYGTVVDVYIPNRKSKAGKRFAFVRFIRVINLDRLINNLCTIWIGRMHLHANVVRFARPPKRTAYSISTPANPGTSSFASVLKGNHMPPYTSPSPAIVMDDACVVHRNLKLHVMGKVKNYASIPNLYVLLDQEGFKNVKLVYLGGLWVMIELESLQAKESFMQHVGVASWFSHLRNAQMDFISRDRIVSVNLEGVPLHAWTRATFIRIGSKWGEVLELEEGTDDMFARKRLYIKTNQEDTIFEKFKIIIKGKVFVIRAKELFVWAPIFKGVMKPESEEVHEDNEAHDVEPGSSLSQFMDLSSRVFEKVQEDKEYKSSDVYNTKVSLNNGGFILDALDDMIKVGQIMGYDMDGCVKDMKRIIRTQGVHGALKKAIRIWVTDYRKSQSGLRDEIKTKLKDIDLQLDRGGVNDDILLSRMNLMKQLQDIKSLESSDFIQKAKLQWAVEGDENSKFFHGVINRRRSNLAIKGVMVDGIWVDDPSNVKNELCSHFATRFQHPTSNRSKIDFLFPNRLCSDQSELLEVPISSVEIRNAVWACGENKSPGPDGFTFEFFRKFWDVIGPDFSLAVLWFFDHCSF